MAKVTITVCDRCGDELRYFGWTTLLGKTRRLDIRSLFNGNADGYSYMDDRIELCAKCAKKLDEFLDGVELEEAV